jgi:hypothetical protein
MEQPVKYKENFDVSSEAEGPSSGRLVTPDEVPSLDRNVEILLIFFR